MGKRCIPCDLRRIRAQFEAKAEARKQESMATIKSEPVIIETPEIEEIAPQVEEVVEVVAPVEETAKEVEAPKKKKSKKAATEEPAKEPEVAESQKEEEVWNI